MPLIAWDKLSQIPIYPVRLQIVPTPAQRLSRMYAYLGTRSLVHLHSPQRQPTLVLKPCRSTTLMHSVLRQLYSGSSGRGPRLSCFMLLSRKVWPRHKTKRIASQCTKHSPLPSLSDVWDAAAQVLTISVYMCRAHHCVHPERSMHIRNGVLYA